MPVSAPDGQRRQRRHGKDAPPRPAGQASVEVDDLRYGYGDEPAHGLWGLRFQIGADGRPSAPGERFHRRPHAAVVSTLGLLWRATFEPAAAAATP